MHDLRQIGIVILSIFFIETCEIYVVFVQSIVAIAVCIKISSSHNTLVLSNLSEEAKCRCRMQVQQFNIFCYRAIAIILDALIEMI